MVATTTGKAPGGTVKLFEDKAMLAKASLKDGIADFTVTKLSAGTHLVIAEYSGDSEHAPASSTHFRQVVK
jgi:Bacterial Ig-like domain (group 3)